MKSTLWKMTALAGVIGAGSLVLFQAQKNLSQQPVAGDSSEQDEKFEPPASPDSTNGPDNATEVASLAGSESHAESELPPQQGDEPGLPAQSEPAPTVEADAVAEAYNPFVDGPQPSASPSSDPSPSDVGAGRSRFAGLVASFTESVGLADPPDEPETQEGDSPGGFSFGDQRLPETAAAPTTSLSSGGSANPFAHEDTELGGSNDSPGNERLENERFESEPTLAGLPSVESQSPPATTPGDNPFAAGAARAPLSAPVPDDEHPGLAAAPFDAANDRELFPSEEAGQQEAPGLANLGTDEPVQPQASDPFDVVQASNEEPVTESGEPNLFLILPGGPAKPTAKPVTESATVQRHDSQPQWTTPPTLATPDPPNEYQADAPPLLPSASPQAPQQAERQPQNIIALDEAYEVTIHPRAQSTESQFSSDAANRPADEPTMADVDPFGPSTPPSPSQRSATQPPSSEDTSPFPNPFPDTQSLSEAATPPSPTERPTARPASGLLLPSAPSNLKDQPALPQEQIAGQQQLEPRAVDLDSDPQEILGVGTIEADSPIGTQQAQLTIEKQAPADAVVGRPLIYSIRVRNVGRTVAENVVVRDVTPKGSRLVGTIPQAELDEADNRLVWRLGKLAPGESTTIKVKVTPTDAGSIGSVATVSFEAAVASRTIITAPELKLTIQGPEEVEVGEKAAYRFTLTNAGSADANGVYIRNLIPDGFEHPRGDDLEYEIGVLRRGQSREIDLTLLAINPGGYQNRAILGADGDVSVEAAMAVSVLKSRLTVRREGPANRFVGRAARFTNTITNESRSALREITVVETVPAGVRFDEASDGGVYDPQRQTVTWRFPQLEAGSQQQVHISVVPMQANEHVTTVKAFDARGSMAEVGSRLTVVGFSSLKIDVAHDGAPVPVGEEVALRLTIINRGTAAANQVRTLVEVPPEMRFVEAKGPVRYTLVSSNLIEFEAINSLEIGGEQQFDIVLVAARKGNARVRVELQSAELTRPLNQEELVVIHPNQQ